LIHLGQRDLVCGARLGLLAGGSEDVAAQVGVNRRECVIGLDVDRLSASS
jgi:hypothetical protein